MGEAEKNWERRWDLTEGAFMEKPPFPEEGERAGELEEVSLEELLLNRRGIAEGSSGSGWGQRVLAGAVGKKEGALVSPRVQTDD